MYVWILITIRKRNLNGFLSVFTDDQHSHNIIYIYIYIYMLYRRFNSGIPQVQAEELASRLESD